MRFNKICHVPILALLLIAAGCSSTVQIKVEEDFPPVLFKPRDIHTTVVFDEQFRTYSAQPNANVSIDLGDAQVNLLTKAFAGLFAELEVVSAREQVKPDSELVIIPSVHEVQLSTPSDSYLNVFEVWIKYNLDIETVDGDAIDSWFMPAYGENTKFLLSFTF